MISAELKHFLESGISILVGTRDARLAPDCFRALGARVEEGGRELTVFAPDAVARASLANLRDNGRVAVCFTRPEDHRSIQLKGRVLELRPADEAERRLVDRYRSALAAILGEIGLPPRTTLRMNHWPCHAVRFEVEAVFVQTPGPGAGERLDATNGVPA